MADNKSIFFNGTATLRKAYAPKNVIEWDKNTKQDIGTTVHIQSEVTVSGVTYTTTTDVVIECKDVWALAGQWDGQALRLYACATPNSTGSSIITTTTTIKGYPDGDRTTTNTTEGTIGATASMLGTYAIPSGETGSVSGANFIPLFAGYNEPINYLNTGEGLTDDTNTNGLSNGSPVPTEGNRTWVFDYRQLIVNFSNGINSMTNPTYRRGAYGVKVSASDGTYIWLPIEIGASWSGDGPRYVAEGVDGGYKMTDTLGVTQYFPDELFESVLGTAIYNKTNDGVNENNGDYYCYVVSNGTDYQSMMPASQLPYDTFDIIDSTFSMDCPIFSSQEKLIQYLLGEIDESESETNSNTPNMDETENGTPSQTMISGEGVNFTC